MNLIKAKERNGEQRLFSQQRNPLLNRTYGIKMVWKNLKPKSDNNTQKVKAKNRRVEKMVIGFADEI